MAASSLTRCGLFAVRCNCTITASTISSLMPSKSISRLGAPSSSSASASGDGGGVCSYFSMLFAAASGFEGGDICDCGFDDADDDDDADEACDCFNFLRGGWSDGAVDEGGERFAAAAAAAALEACVTGRWMPSDGSDSDFRRVL